MWGLVPCARQAVRQWPHCIRCIHLIQKPLSLLQATHFQFSNAAGCSSPLLTTAATLVSARGKHTAEQYAASAGGETQRSVGQRVCYPLLSALQKLGAKSNTAAGGKDRQQKQASSTPWSPTAGRGQQERCYIHQHMQQHDRHLQISILQAGQALLACHTDQARQILSRAVHELLDPQHKQLKSVSHTSISNLLGMCQRTNLALEAQQVVQLLEHAATAPPEQQWSLLDVQRYGAAARAARVLPAEAPASAAAALPLPQQQTLAAWSSLYHQALQQMVQDQQLQHPNTVLEWLHEAEMAGIPVAQEVMQQILLQALQPAFVARAAPRHVCRLLRAAAFSGLVLPASFDLQPLLARLLLLKQQQPVPAAARKTALIAVSRLQAAVPSSSIQKLLEWVLHAYTPAGPLQLPAADAKMILKALACLRPQQLQHVSKQQMERLIQPLVGSLPQQQKGANEAALLASVARMNVDLPVHLLEPVVQAAVDHLLDMAGNSSSRTSSPACEDTTWSLQFSADGQQRLQGKVQTALAAAGAAAQSDVGVGSGPDVDNGAAPSAGKQQQMSPQHMAQLVKALANLQTSIPADAVGPLTESFLAAAPSAKAIALWVAGLSRMGRAISIRQLQTFLQLLQLHQVPHIDSNSSWQPNCQQQDQQQQQQQAFSSMDAVDVGNFLWGVANMGYTLPPQALEQLVQQQLSQLRQRHINIVNSVAQTLWSVSSMGPWQLDNKQQQQQQDDLKEEGTAAGPRHSSHTAVQQQALPDQLILQLLEAMLQDSSSNLGRRHGSCTAEASKAAAGSAASAPPSPVMGAEEKPWNSPSSGEASSQWPLSLAVWCVAMCDARSCQQQVLQICSRLSEPWAWQHLRRLELGQLACVHLWLGGSYTWKDTGGLWQCFSKEQMLAILEARKQFMLATQVTSRRSLAQKPDPQQQASKEQQCQEGASTAQRKLFQLVRRSKGIASAELEAVTADGLFGIDILAKTVNGCSLAVEFDGPFHYSVAVKFAESTGNNSDTGSSSVDCNRQQQQLLVLNRSTLFRNSALAARGYKVVCVPFYDWPDHKLPAERWLYLQRLLAGVFEQDGHYSKGSSSYQTSTAAVAAAAAME